MILDRAKITENIKSAHPFSITFKHADKELRMYLEAIYAKVLTQTDQLYILTYFTAIMNEIIGNAQKANAKRIYFANSRLDLNDPGHYMQGMKGFKEEMLSNEAVYRQYLEKNNLTITLSFAFAKDNIIISVINSAVISQKEKERIRLRIHAANGYKNFMDAYNDILDTSEGAGLGITLSIITLRAMGIDSASFSIDCDEKKTTVSFPIPLMLKPSHINTAIKQRVLNEIKGLPTFPDHVLRLMELCDNPDSSLERIVAEIMTDPALSAEILKLSNSAGFISGRKIGEIQEAVKIIGLKNVKAMLILFQVRIIIEKNFSLYEAIWDHCLETAFYARKIGHQFYGIEVSDRAYLAGLLHDMGKIILLSIDEELVLKIFRHSRARKMVSANILEEVSIGMSHAEIGSILAKKWDFPNYLIDAICHHHDPLSASEANYKIVETVYLANMICGIREKRYNYYFLYENILVEHEINSEIAFQAFCDKLTAEYELNNS